MNPSALRHVIVVNDHGHVNGGAAKVAIESALWLKGGGKGVSFVAGSGPMDPRLAEAGVHCEAIAAHDVHTDPDRRRAMQNGLWNREAARALASHIGRYDPRSTVVHLHSWTKALSPSVGPVITGSAAAHVATLHEYFLACPNGAFYDYNSGHICTKRAMGFGCLTTNCDARRPAHKAWRVARQAILKTAGRLPGNLREIINISPRQLSIMGDYFGEETRWHHLPNAVGERPASRVPVEGSDIFLFVGRIAPEKGAIIAAEAAKRAGVRMVFAGDGPDQDAASRANPGAEFLGWLGSAELERWTKKARCLVFPSLWYEGYPLVVADALRLGIPVLVSTASNATALIEDGQNGLHVPARDIAAWTEAMTRMKSDDLVQAMGASAFRSGADLLGYDDYTDRLVAIYEQVLERKLEQGARLVLQDAGAST